MKTISLLSFLAIFITVGGMEINEFTKTKIPSLGIHDGLFEHGERAIILSPEGLLIRRVCINCKGYDNNIRFIRINELSTGKLNSLTKFLEDNDFFSSFDSEYLNEGNGLVVPRRYTISNPESNCEKEILDSDYLGNLNPAEHIERQKLDSLVLLMNSIIPPKYFEHYSIQIYQY